MAKYRYIDGRQYEQQADGTWGPTRQQVVMDEARQRDRDQAAERRAQPACSHQSSSNDFATGLLLGGLFMGGLNG